MKNLPVKAIVRIGEAARETGVHPNTIRNLEKRGVITCGRDWRGHRRFTRADVARLLSLVVKGAGV